MVCLTENIVLIADLDYSIVASAFYTDSGYPNLSFLLYLQTTVIHFEYL